MFTQQSVLSEPPPSTQDACKILLVEDHDDEAYLFKRVLKTMSGFTIAWHARNGAESIAYLQGTGVYGNREKYPFPDLMVLDVKMPQMDGFEVLERIQGKFSKLKVGVFTSSEDPTDMERAIHLGAHLYQPKTYEPDGFVRFLEWLQKLAAEDGRIASGAQPPARLVAEHPIGAKKPIHDGSRDSLGRCPA